MDIKEIAKEVRKQLKKELPKCKFSVRMSGGGGVRVSWTNGPSTAQVRAITEPIEDFYAIYILIDRMGKSENLSAPSVIWAR